ncbi:MAG: diguanylate cyclase [Myxococcaceae bacterium]|nr:diguanylate cyclase [Myxococcaceae bacterium]
MARILLIDDEKMARALYGDYLAAGGHEVTAVGTVAEAKDALARERFDAVVTDLLLSDGDGMEVLELVKSNFPSTEVVVITALDKVDPAVRAIKGGASEYLVKPVSPEALQHAVSRALTARQLLRENEKLRQHVALLETAQRIATTLDREKLVQTASHAFAQTTGAATVLLYLRPGRGDAFRLEGVFGSGEGDREAVEAALRPHVESAGTTLQKIAAPDGFTAAWLVPAADGDQIFGHVAVLFRQAPPEEAEQSAQYLARHLGLALRNLGRFAEVEDLAYLDDLTHLFNVRYLDLVLDRELKSAKQTSGTFSLLFLDLDYFKSVNDTHGHLVGSKLLVEVARIIKGCVRDNDVVVRYGGDEYVILLRATDSGGALKVAERIRRTMETHQFLSREGYGLQVTTCIGVASYPEHAQDKASLLDFADRAMYRGKKGSRNVIYMASSGLEATPAARHSVPTGPRG